MFSDNNRISTRQVFRLFVFDFIGMSTLVLPGVLAQLNGCDGLFAIALGGILSSVYLWYLAKVMREMDGELTSYMKKSFPVWVYVVLAALLLIHCIIEAGYGAYVFADVMKKSLVGEESYTLILVLILLVTAYAIRSGIESRARVYEVLFWILFVPLLIMFVIAANDVDFSYMGPFFTHSVSSVADGGFEVFCYLTPLFLVLFLPAYVKKKSRKKMIASVYAALWFAVIVLLIMYMILLGNFGDRALGTMQYPAVILMSNIHLRGGFVKRLDAFMIAIWFFTLFALVGVFLFYAEKILYQLLPGGKNEKTEKTSEQKKGRMDWKKWGTLGGVLVLTFLVAEWFCYGDLTEWYIAYMRWLGVPFLVLFPLVILVVGKTKRKRTVVNGILFVLCFAGTMQLAGCGATELEDRCFPMLAAVDKEDTQILFSYGFPELSQKENTDLAEAKVSAAMSSGANFAEALHVYEGQLNKVADCNHMKVLVIGQRFVEDEAHFTEMLSYLREKELYPRNTYVCFTDTADDLYEIEENLPEDLGSYIEAYLQNHETEKQIRLLNLGILLDEQLNQRQVLQFPYLTVQNQAIVWESNYVINHGKPAGRKIIDG